MSVRKFRISVVAVVAGLLLAGCGGTSDRAVVRAKTIEPSPDTTTSEHSPDSTTEALPPPRTAGGGDADWFASANKACQTARVQYQQVSSAMMSQDPTALPYMAAATASSFEKAVDALPVPPSARAKSFKASVQKYAASLLKAAKAMGGTQADVNKAGIGVDAAVKLLVAAAKDAGADSCVAMTNEI
jgi:hypothetical protein